MPEICSLSWDYMNVYIIYQEAVHRCNNYPLLRYNHYQLTGDPEIQESYLLVTRVLIVEYIVL